MAQKDTSGQVKPEYSGLDDLDRRVTALYKAKTGKVFDEEKDRLARIRR